MPPSASAGNSNRKAAPHPSVAEHGPDVEWTEDTLAQHLREGRGFILIGQPLDGKSRTLYEILKRLEGYDIVKPFKDQSLPPEAAFSILRGCRVVLLVEDMNDYAGGVLDLRQFFATLSRHTEICVVAATCRDGPELAVVGQQVATGLSRFFEEIPCKLTLLPPSPEQKLQLAQSIGQQANLQQIAAYPTVGSIAMDNPLRAMRQRFEALRLEQQDTLRALKLLAAAGVLPFSSARLLAVLQHIFNRTLHLGDCLDALAEQAFVRRPSHQDPISPEPAYLLRAVAYTEGKSPQADFPALGEVLAGLEDVMGLVYVGTTYGMRPIHDDEQALQCFERALRLQPENLPALYNKAAILANRGQNTDALELLEYITQHDPDIAEVHYTKSVVFARLGRYQESVEAIEKALQFRPYAPLAWTYMGGQLICLGRYQEALEAYDQSLSLQPDLPISWFHKGIILVRLGRQAEAIE